MMKQPLAACAVILVGLAACASTSERKGQPPLQTVPKVELQRYLGTWYEIASYPQRFQKGCTGTIAQYELKDDGNIKVTNRCRKGSLQGEEKVSTGRARVVDKATNAKLEVSFFGPFWGDYWVIELAEDYSYAVVGHPSRDYLWILSRTPVMEQATYDRLLTRLREVHGYELSRINKTIQPGAEGGAPSP